MAAKTYDYIVTLKPSKSYDAFDWIAQLLLLTAVALVAYLCYHQDDSQKQLVGIVYIVCIVIAWIYSRVTGSKYGWAFFFAAMSFFHFKMWFGLGYIVMAFLERQVKFKQELGFDEEGVTFNTFPKKTYQWHEVSNVILKDGILTVDLQNNKILQKEIETEVVPMMEKEFNDFCKQYLYKKQTNSLAV